MGGGKGHGERARACVCVCLAQLAVARMRECKMESALESDLESLVFTHTQHRLEH